MSSVVNVSSASARNSSLCKKVALFGSLELLNGKTSFQSRTVEQPKSYTIVESWASIQGNQNVPLFTRGTFSSVCK